MATGAGQVQCAGCGATFVIPAGYEHQKGRCRHCGTEIGPLLGESKGKPAEPVGDYVRGVALGIGWGMLGALAVGGCVGLLAKLLTESSFGAVVALAGMGGVFGFTVMATWSLINRFSLDLIGGLVCGALVCFSIGTVDYYGEWAVAASPDLPYFYFAFISLLGGCVVGAAISQVIAWWERR